MKTIADLAYLAGVVDGEGSILIRKQVKRGHPNYSIRLHVANTSEALMLWLTRWLGGRVRALPRRPGYKVVYTWTLSGRKAAIVIDLIEPYLIIKRDHAKLALELQSLMRFGRNQHNPLTENELQQREDMNTAMHTLNRRGE